MKNIAFIVFLVTLGVQSCKEYLPENVVVNTSIDTTYINPQPIAIPDRYVLIEEFTGASCVNCPSGHNVLKSISSTYGDRVNIIGLHQSVLAEPVEPTDQDLRTPEAASIAAEFGVASMPLALIDRVTVNGQTALSRTIWTSTVSSQLNVSPKVALDASVKAIQSNSCKYTFKVEFPQEYSNDVSYYISLVENGIFVTQRDGASSVPHYEQFHVLRKMYTPYNGKTLDKKSVNYEKGRTYVKEIQLDLNNLWNYNNCEIILYVIDNVTKEVLQSKLIHLQ